MNLKSGCFVLYWVCLIFDRCHICLLEPFPPFPSFLTSSKRFRFQLITHNQRFKFELKARLGLDTPNKSEMSNSADSSLLHKRAANGVSRGKTTIETRILITEPSLNPSQRSKSTLRSPISVFLIKSLTTSNSLQNEPSIASIPFDFAAFRHGCHYKSPTHASNDIATIMITI